MPLTHRAPCQTSAHSAHPQLPLVIRSSTLPLSSPHSFSLYGVLSLGSSFALLGEPIANVDLPASLCVVCDCSYPPDRFHDVFPGLCSGPSTETTRGTAGFQQRACPCQPVVPFGGLVQSLVSPHLVRRSCLGRAASPPDACGCDHMIGRPSVGHFACNFLQTVRPHAIRFSRWDLAIATGMHALLGERAALDGGSGTPSIAGCAAP